MMTVCRTVCPDNCQLCSYGGDSGDSTDKIVPVGTIRCLECNAGYHYTSPTQCSGQIFSVVYLLYIFCRFLSRDAMHSAVMKLHVICLSVRPSVTFGYRDHIGWNSLKIISRPNSLRPMRLLTATWAIWCNRNTVQIRVE